MVREHAIRFEELAARRIGAEFRKDLGGKESAAAVAGIDDDVHPFQRTVVHPGTEAGADLAAQMQRIEVDQVQRGNGSRRDSHGRRLGSQAQDFRDLALFQTAVDGKEFQSVAVIRQMAGRNHDGAIHVSIFKNDGHEHSRCRSQAAVRDVDALTEEAAEDGFFHHSCRYAGIVADGNVQVTHLFIQLLRQKLGKASGNAVDRFRYQRDVFTGDAGNGDAADITAIL